MKKQKVLITVVLAITMLLTSLPLSNVFAMNTELDSDDNTSYDDISNLDDGDTNLQSLEDDIVSIEPLTGVLSVQPGVWFETVFAYWQGAANRTYNVYVSPAGRNQWRWVNNPSESVRNQSTWRNNHSHLARNVGSNRWRVDVPGLAATESYDLRIVELNNGTPTGRTDYARGLRPAAFERQGFAFSSTSPFGQTTGAYNPDGTLRDDAVVIYITPQNVMTFENPWNSTRGFAGLFNSSRMQNRGVTNVDADGISLRNATPVAIRFMDGRVSRVAAGAGEMVAVNRTANVTIEGIGPNAEVFAFGFSIVRSSNIVVRNLHFRNHTDDAILVQGDADDPQNMHGPLPNINQGGRNIANGVMSVNTWITHNRFTVDAANADGHVDYARSTYFTQSFNVFTRNGRGGLSGNGVNNPHFRGTYHNNHYIDTNSRAPRLRAGEIHIFNNFYDYSSHHTHDYAIGAGHHAHVIAEGNYFSNTRRPFIISNQGNGGTILTADQPGFIITSMTTSANHNSSTHRHVEQRIFNLAATLVPNQLTNVTNFDVTSDQGFPRQDNNRAGRPFWWTQFSSPQAWPIPVTVTTALVARQRVLDHAGPMRQINQIQPYLPPTQAPGGGGTTPTPPGQSVIASGTNVAITGGGSGDGTFNSTIQQLANVSSHNLRQAELDLDVWFQTDGTNRWISIMVQMSDGSLLTLRNRAGTTANNNAIERFAFGMANGANLQERQATATWGGDQAGFTPEGNVLASATAINTQFGSSLRSPSNSAATPNNYRMALNIQGSTLTATLTVNGDTARQMNVSAPVANGATIHSIHAWSHGTATQSTLNISRWSLSQGGTSLLYSGSRNVTGDTLIQNIAGQQQHVTLVADNWRAFPATGANADPGWTSIWLELSNGQVVAARYRREQRSDNVAANQLNRLALGFGPRSLMSGTNDQSLTDLGTGVGGVFTSTSPAPSGSSHVSRITDRISNFRFDSTSVARANTFAITVDISPSGGAQISFNVNDNNGTPPLTATIPAGSIPTGTYVRAFHASVQPGGGTLHIPNWRIYNGF